MVSSLNRQWQHNPEAQSAHSLHFSRSLCCTDEETRGFSGSMNSYCADSVLLKGVICGALPCIFKIKTKCFSTFFLLRFQSPVCAYGLLGMSSCKNNIFSYKDKGHISDLKEKELLNPSLLNKPNILEWILTHIYMRKKSSTSRFLLKNVFSDGSMGRACSFSRSPPRFE